MKTHNVKVTPEQHRQLLALQEIWQTQSFFGGNHEVAAAKIISEYVEVK